MSKRLLITVFTTLLRAGSVHAADHFLVAREIMIKLT